MRRRYSNVNMDVHCSNNLPLLVIYHVTQTLKNGPPIIHTLRIEQVGTNIESKLYTILEVLDILSDIKLITRIRKCFIYWIFAY